ncbi:inovirus Gp2 family protein [Salmonella enterica]|uniref:Inovirus Gp2 family protein n=3 Tax=Enterobacteriaceae TaxID=543 RepID=A0A3V2HZ23_SALSE|nr:MULTISPECIES: inovirus Gp2 family protein [Enterobacterales]ECC3098662.1 inovirus Gp2 family protein [Salmonella enterica subsp. enterica]EDB5583809.1 inovirus Gp2 family protein [Salmonella enterica subsp. enterica serovar Schwarzengrund]EDB5626170.1 inovirus Gp2 family protein [Salmonella enterica subsp. enterica serovar Kentucky]EDX5041759.1 inovirus Gp2 family protein [Salmonella enterica subsp. enterica serovar Westhampton]EDX7478303.1 inovirus Gp2 family protein [Salmonella enterica s
MNLYDSEYGSHVKSYKERIIEVINKAVKEHGRTLAIRVDLHDPVILDNGDNISCIANTDSGAISRFTNSLKAKLAADEQRKRKEGKRVHRNTLRYAWVREFTQNGKRHFHVFLFLNKDAYYHLGDFNLDEDTLRTMITSAWCSALNLTPEEGQHLVQYPANGKYTLNRDDILNDIYPGDLLNRIDYLTKVKSKIFDDGNRSFGCSNN